MLDNWQHACLKQPRMTSTRKHGPRDAAADGRTSAAGGGAAVPGGRKRAVAHSETAVASGHDELDQLGLATPALRALRGAGFDTLVRLAAASDQELLALHGMGANALRKIRQHA